MSLDRDRPSFRQCLARAIGPALLFVAVLAWLCLSAPLMPIAPPQARPDMRDTPASHVLALMDAHGCWNGPQPAGMVAGSVVVTPRDSPQPLWSGDLLPDRAAQLLDETLRQIDPDPGKRVNYGHRIHGFCPPPPPASEH